MIKVIGKNEVLTKIYRAKCYECGTWLEYEASDTTIGVYGGRELVCPACGKRLILDEPDGISLNSNNIEFPTHFMPTDTNAMDIDDVRIKTWVRNCLSRLETEPNRYFWQEGYGNTIVLALNLEDEYDIYVAKNYWECEIPKEEM